MYLPSYHLKMKITSRAELVKASLSNIFSSYNIVNVLKLSNENFFITTGILRAGRLMGVVTVQRTVQVKLY